MVCKSQASTFTYTHTHTHKYLGRHFHACGQTITWYTQVHLFTHNHTKLSTLLRLVWRWCAKWANPIFSQLSSAIQNDPHKLWARRKKKEETWPVETFMAFPTIAQDYNGVFTTLLYNPPFSRPAEPPRKLTRSLCLMDSAHSKPPAATKLSQLWRSLSDEQPFPCNQT